MRAAREGAQFIDESLVPRRLDHPDKAMLTLRHERIGAVLFRALFAFTGDAIALQQAGEVVRFELASAAWILRNADIAGGAVNPGRGEDPLLAFSRAEPAAD
jgi:hypothetical protein